MLWGRGIEAQNPRCDDSRVAVSASGEVRGEAVLVGGPMDGNRQQVDAETIQLSVVMSDGQQHRYLRTEEVRTDEDGRNRTVFTWQGRYYGPK